MSNYDSFTEPPDGAPEDSRRCPRCGNEDCHCDQEHAYCGRVHCDECHTCDVAVIWVRVDHSRLLTPVSKCCEAPLIHGDKSEVQPEEVE